MLVWPSAQNATTNWRKQISGHHTLPDACSKRERELNRERRSAVSNLQHGNTSASRSDPMSESVAHEARASDLALSPSLSLLAGPLVGLATFEAGA